MKYQICIFHGSEGWNFHPEEFDTVDEAVKFAIKNSFGCDFLVVTVIDWKAS